MGVTEAPVLAKVYRWPRAMPQYLVGHLERLAAIDGRLARWPGLFLTGAGYRGVGIPDCIRDGLDTAERVRAFLTRARRGTYSRFSGADRNSPCQRRPNPRLTNMT